MDRRSWPWKKKTIKETFATADSMAVSSGTASKKQADQDHSKNMVNYIQLSRERYAHLCEMEYQVKELHGKLSDAMSELTNKDNLVKLQSKVAEEAISGWDKAEAEASTLKSNLESTILLKITAEEKAVKLDGALKECMKQVNHIKEENEKTLADVLSANTKELENVKFEFKMKLDTFEQELVRCTSENEALSRLIQERSHMLKKIGEGKNQAEAEIEAMKADIQSYKMEISSLKYEVHVVSKELEIRNEEKNMHVRSAEAANRQHLEGVKKIVNLEAECQRLRGLVRKKLPGPSALAQMKREVESSVKDEKEDKPRGSPVKGYSPHLGSAQAFSVANDNHHFRRANEFLTARLVAMEEETNILKEALSKCNTELLASREMLAETSTKLKIVETQMQVLSQQKCLPDFSADSSLSKKESKQHSLTSMSDDGIDEGSCTESWGTASISQLPQLWKGCTGVDKSIKTNSSDQLDLMDDFLAMEKLACLSTAANENKFALDNNQNLIEIENSGCATSVDNSMEVRSQKVLLPDLSPSVKIENVPTITESCKNEILLAKLQREITTVFESQNKDINMRELLTDIKKILQNVEEELPQSVGSSSNDVCLTKAEGLKKAILQIHDFVVSLYKKVTGIQDIPSDVCEHGQKVQEFTSSLDNIMSTEPSVHHFLQSLSIVLFETEELCLRRFQDKYSEGERSSPDCVEKVTLLEKKAVIPETGRHEYTDSSSDPEVFHERSTYENSEMRDNFNSGEDLEQLKLKSNGVRAELNISNEILEQVKQELLQVEEQKSVLKIQLTECQKSNSLASTQLKCMTESYKSLESRCDDLENEIQILRIKGVALHNELMEERCTCQDYLAKYKDLHEQIQRKEKNSILSEKDTAMKINHEEIAAAAEKLTECQETIDLLGRQLKTLQPQAFSTFSNASGRDNNTDGLREIIEKVNECKTQGSSRPRVENLGSILQRSGCESPFDTYSCHFSPSKIKSSSVSPVSSKRPKHRSTWSCSSNSSNIIDEKHGRGFIRFFSGKKMTTTTQSSFLRSCPTRSGEF